MQVVNHFPPGPLCSVTLEFKSLELEKYVDGDSGTASPNLVVHLKSPTSQKPPFDVTTAALKSIAL